MRRNTICIIDDDPIYVFTLKTMIRIHNLFDHIIVFDNGQEALQYFQTSPHHDELPDLVLLDINMPVMDGWEFIDEFRNIKPKLSKQMPVYIVSSSINEADITKAQSYSDVAGYLVKPLKVADLQNII